MILLLRSHDHFGAFADFDPATNELTIHPEQQESQGRNTAGWFASVDGNYATLFRLGHDLFLAYCARVYPITEDTYATVEGGEIKRKFTLTASGKPVVSIDYQIPKSPIPAEWDFTQTEPEDFDFFLFVRNMLKDPGRRRFAMGFPRE